MKQMLYEKLIQYILENQDRFYRVAYSYTRHQEDAIKTWFYKILINECLKIVKKRKSYRDTCREGRMTAVCI